LARIAKAISNTSQHLQALSESTLQDAEDHLIFKHVQQNNSLYQILLGNQGTLQM